MVKPMVPELMVQQQINGAWQHMVGVMMLNRARGVVVKKVLPEFLKRWPTPEKYLRSRSATVQRILHPLGFYRRREEAIRKMSQDFLNWDGQDANDLYGIGRYGSDSYRIFFNHEYDIHPLDKELRAYLEGMGYPQPNL